MAVDRSYYQPTEAQRVELKLAAQVMKQRLAERRRQREAFEAALRELPQAIAAFERIGFDAAAARELADIQLAKCGA